MRKYMKDNADNIINRIPFKAGSIHGYWYSSSAYLIKSYTTPIALYSNGYWYLTQEMFSATTSHQQEALRVILSNEKTVAMSPEMFASQIKALDGLPAPK